MKVSTAKDFQRLQHLRILIAGQFGTKRGRKMQRRTANSNRKIEKNIEARSDGFSFRVRMKIGETLINETFFTLDEARAYRDLLRAGKSTDKDQERVLRAKAEKKKAAGQTVDTLLKRYLEEVTPTKKGKKEEGYAIGRLRRMKSFSTLPVYLADGEAIEKLKRELSAATLSSTTIRKYLMIVSHVFRTAITRRWCVDLQNPVKTVELPRPARMRSRRFEADEFEYLHSELEKFSNPQILAFFELLVETACRRGELLRLRVRDVDLTGRTASLLDTKNGEDRVIGLSSRAVELLKERMQSITTEKVALITKQVGEKQIFDITIRSIRYAFEKAVSLAKEKYRADCEKENCLPRLGFLENIRLHDCRREATSRMFEKGLDIMEVSSQTGHKTLSMLRGYTHLRASALAQKLG
ncbi:site-specific integrase [uncultured Herbaspirillum sp.]|uniref:tyrosine-type recombinase/integrase n=1 Tax=uncultured Herbaspirillum sp. TaxID=160236 RepID=UPI002585E252|nr:site-specific integrase [uncultured Herbaspirillum sp.]